MADWRANRKYSAIPVLILLAACFTVGSSAANVDGIIRNDEYANYTSLASNGRETGNGFEGVQAMWDTDESANTVYICASAYSEKTIPADSRGNIVFEVRAGDREVTLTADGSREGTSKDEIRAVADCDTAAATFEGSFRFPDGIEKNLTCSVKVTDWESRVSNILIFTVRGEEETSTEQTETEKEKTVKDETEKTKTAAKREADDGENSGKAERKIVTTQRPKYSSRLRTTKAAKETAAAKTAKATGAAKKKTYTKKAKQSGNASQTQEETEQFDGTRIYLLPTTQPPETTRQLSPGEERAKKYRYAAAVAGVLVFTGIALAAMKNRRADDGGEDK